MGGKSRKRGQVSKRLIDRIKNQKRPVAEEEENKKPATPTKDKGRLL